MEEETFIHLLNEYYSYYNLLLRMDRGYNMFTIYKKTFPNLVV